MFSGIVDHCGSILKMERAANSSRFWIQSQFKEFEKGESVAVDGVCLTVVDSKEGVFSCDVSPETLKLTQFKSLKSGMSVNLERSLRVGDRNGGHMVSGHVDGVLRVAAIKAHEEHLEVQFDGVSSEFRGLVIKKGSIAINGVSLTVNEVFERGFSVMLIPHTQERTNFREITVDSWLNVEYDWMTKVIREQVRTQLEHIRESDVSM